MQTLRGADTLPMKAILSKLFLTPSEKEPTLKNHLLGSKLFPLKGNILSEEIGVQERKQ